MVARKRDLSRFPEWHRPKLGQEIIDRLSRIDPHARRLWLLDVGQQSSTALTGARRPQMKRLLVLLLFSTLCSAGTWANLYLQMYAYGYDTYAVWKVQAGLPDSSGGANFGLELAKETDQSNATPYVYVRGISGQPTSFLTEGTGLSWEHRNDGFCGPKLFWVVGIIPKNSTVQRYLILRCSFATQSTGSADGWTKDSFSAADITTSIHSQFGSLAPNVLEGKITYLQVVLYTPMSSIVLDNLRVNGWVWTSPFNERYCPGIF
ncbi:MAG: hypothetical protein ACRD2Y_15235 [Terriglobales bacterium]